MNCFRPLERWDRGFESHLRHGCLCAFIMFVLFCASCLLLLVSSVALVLQWRRYVSPKHRTISSLHRVTNVTTQKTVLSVTPRLVAHHELTTIIPCPGVFVVVTHCC
jgi:hypothetical protein